MLKRLAAACLFGAILLAYCWHASVAGLADGYLDPIGKILPQDESLYSSITLRMARDGDWLTPHFLGRLALFKPPLLYWTSAAAVRAFGETVLALRLPSLFAGALVPALLFFCIGGARGVAAALLLAAHPLWFTFARHNLTDSLLALWITLAAVSLYKQSRLGFAATTAAAILTKGIAGLTPLFILLLYSALRREQPLRWLPAVAGAAALASPWFLYQLAVHPRWFWAEFVQVEILGYSLGNAVPQTSQESHILFYAKRLWFADPVLLILLAIALPFLWRRRDDAKASLLAAWLIIVPALAVVNSYRNIAYMLAAIPAMAWIAAEYAPWSAGRRDWLLPGILLATLVPWRAAQAEMKPPVGSSEWVQRYAALHRPNPLVVAEAEDELIAATLGLPRLHYLFIQPEAAFRRYGLDFLHLGIALTVDQFPHRRELTPQFAARLREWQLDTTQPIGTVIAAPNVEDLRRLIAASPDVDFLLPSRLRHVSGHTHELRDVSPTTVFLLAREPR